MPPMFFCASSQNESILETFPLCKYGEQILLHVKRSRGNSPCSREHALLLTSVGFGSTSLTLGTSFTPVPIDALTQQRQGVSSSKCVDTEFDVKRATNAEHNKRRNNFSQLTYPSTRASKKMPTSPYRKSLTRRNIESLALLHSNHTLHSINRKFLTADTSYAKHGAASEANNSKQLRRNCLQVSRSVFWPGSWSRIGIYS